MHKGLFNLDMSLFLFFFDFLKILCTTCGQVKRLCVNLGTVWILSKIRSYYVWLAASIVGQRLGC